jgi:hypothetical protein
LKKTTSLEASSRRQDRALRIADRQFYRNTVIGAVGKAVELVAAQPFLGLVAGYVVVDGLGRTRVLRSPDVAALKMMALMTALAPAGAAGLTAGALTGLAASLPGLLERGQRKKEEIEEAFTVGPDDSDSVWDVIPIVDELGDITKILKSVF